MSQINALPIAVTMGDPAGVGGELTIKAWQARSAEKLTPFFAIDDVTRLKALAPDLPIKEITDPSQALKIFDEALPVLPLELPEAPVLGQLSPKNAHAVIESIQRGVEFCLNKKAGGIVTNPIHKAALYDAGFKHPGHTEFIADLCAAHTGAPITPVMMLAAQDLRVVPLTVHIPLKDVPSAVTKELLFEKVAIIDAALKADFGIKNPRIAIAGLNPHAGEGGSIGLEDQEVLEPAIATLQSEGFAVTGPHPADTLFHEEARAHYDIAIGMYHDQALIPLKTLDFHGGVNMTLGLPIIRTSPDHGTALDIAGKGIANAQSFINALKMAGQVRAHK